MLYQSHIHPRWAGAHPRSSGTSDRSVNMGVTQRQRGWRGCSGVILPIQGTEHPLAAAEVASPRLSPREELTITHGRAYRVQQGASPLLCALYEHTARRITWPEVRATQQNNKGLEGNIVFPLLQRGKKARGNSKLDSLRWVHHVASFSCLIIRPLLSHGRILTEF